MAQKWSVVALAAQAFPVPQELSRRGRAGWARAGAARVRPQTITAEAHSRGQVPRLTHASLSPHPEHAIMTESASQALRVK